jgi:fibronectin-binding autotransporter adhesin
MSLELDEAAKPRLRNNMDRSKTMRELGRGLGRVEARGPALEASGRISRRGRMVSEFLAVMRSVIRLICAVFKSPFIGVLLGFCLCSGESYGQTQLWNGSQTTFDPSLRGGNGTWDNVTTNFMDEAQTESESWQNGIAVFAANPGNVTLGDNITFLGMEFESDGYVVAGPPALSLNFLAPATISTDPNLTATISAPINGTGGLDKEGPGTLILRGTNAYSGGTTVSGGILSVGSDTNLGDPAGVITLQNGELLTTTDGFSSTRPITLAAALGDDALVAASGTTATYTGVISGPAGLTIGDGVNGGTVVLTGENTYSSGNTLIKGLSTLQIGNGGATGSIIGNVTDNGNLVFNRSGVVTFSGNISGTGTLIKNGSGTVTLSGTNTYTGGTAVVGGTLQLGDAVTAGSIVGAVDNSATFDLVNADSSGLTSVTTELGGVTNLLNASTVGTATVVTNAGGLFDISQLTTPGVTIVSIAGAGNYDLGAKELTVGDGTSTEVSGTIQDGGTGGGVGGSLIKVGAGTLTLSGTNTYTGGTTITAGTLKIGAGGATGSLTGPVLDNAALVVDRSGTLVLAGPITGTGTLSQAGPGTLNLTGTSGLPQASISYWLREPNPFG